MIEKIIALSKHNDKSVSIILKNFEILITSLLDNKIMYYFFKLIKLYEWNN